MAARAVGGGTSAKRLLLLATTATAVPAMRASALSARRLHSSVRRLSALSAAQTLQQQSRTVRVRIAFPLGSSSSSNNNSSARTLQRTLSTLPTSDSSNSSSSADPQHDEQKRRDDEARTIKKKLSADIEKARTLALHQVVNVPNVITFARILSTPYLAYLIVDGQYEPAIGLLAVAGLSDWLDGYIARTYKQESIIGSFLDPFADKLMIGALSLSMMGSGLLPWPLVTLIFGRDVLLVSGTFYHRLKTKDADTAFFDTSDSGAFEVKPTLLSKVNTALQLALFGLTLTNAAWHVPADPALHALFGVVGATTFASGSEYLWSYINQTGAFRPLHKSVKALHAKAAKSKSAPKE